MLAAGQATISKTTVFTATGPTLVTYASFVNTDSSTRTINFYVKYVNVSNSVRIIPKDFSLNPGEQGEWEGKRTLNAGDRLEIDASAASVVDFEVD